ncbi:hypothetical protein EW093_11760 [Thiospirochaeta perfilievii]|uniref:Uncharacterized protein n=1 Tax=Thiospirochaeta perfilievii TaxID=252967 RepID=A0A5C1QD69_9SPIO|nr:hypothetical protein [Thiospirochaeta perfilievii]QEN05357.1 hypothetical protein EW093_11760 [Thiospirochaeta perfilievii]
MHEGCSGSFANGQQVVDKVRMMGFSGESMPTPLIIECKECGEAFVMKTFESKCDCGVVYAVTPCHASSADNVLAAGKGY